MGLWTAFKSGSLLSWNTKKCKDMFTIQSSIKAYFPEKKNPNTNEWKAKVVYFKLNLN